MDLKNKNALEKLKEMVEDVNIAMMVTDLSNKPLSVVPMTTKKVDEEGNIWFLSDVTSDHNQDIKEDNDVQLIYSKPGSMDFISIYGNAHISKDYEIIDELYSRLDDNWFEGKDDPKLTAIKCAPKEAYYWDTKSNKFVSFLKMGMNTFAGTNMEIGEKGALEID